MVTIFEFIVHLFDFFFFFKQKTAYEMRISDWSSDVCSSDLRKRVERDLDAWFADLRPFERAILLYLKLLRGSVPAEPLTARSGIYLHTPRSEEHTSELQSLMRISYAVFCLKKKKKQTLIDRRHVHKYRVSYTKYVTGTH